MSKKNKSKKIKKLLFIIAIFIIIIDIAIFVYFKFIKNNLLLTLKGDSNVKIELNEEYKEPGYKATYRKTDITQKVKVKGKIDNTKVGKYTLIYSVTYNNKSSQIKRIVNVVDSIKPELKIKGESINLIIGNEYPEYGYSAIDNYDGDITEKVKVDNKIDINTLGEYEVIYSVSDSSKNKTEVSRKVTVVDKPTDEAKKRGVAVLNYHFFYDADAGEKCDLGNCTKTRDFRKQIEYLKENNFKTLTMREFRDWMYGVIEIPEKSVLITVDDGQLGTGFHNGNKLIPILEEYKVNATLFLITSWNDIKNYKSDYLDVESHTHDMHDGNKCSNKPRGSLLLCSSNDAVMYDLTTSISITKSNLGFCFPLYAYDDNSINLVKQAGFQMAFIGGGYKANRNIDKYHIPRYQILQSTSLDSFKSFVN